MADDFQSPYDFVPITSVRRQSVGEGHRACAPGQVRGSIEATYEVLTYLHIGTGALTLGESPYPRLYQPTFRTWRRNRSGDLKPTAAMPGTSLKGAFRSVLEAITHSCVTAASRDAGSVPTLCRLPRRESESAELCPACRLFGTMGYQGKVTVSDALPLSGGLVFAELPELWRPRSEKRHRYLLADGTPKGRKFYFHGKVREGTVPVEVWRSGSQLRVRVSFSGLVEAELGLVLLAMGYPLAEGEPGLALKLGGHKPSCCGSVRLLPGLQLRQEAPAERWTRADFGRSVPAETDLARYTQAAVSSDDFAQAQYLQLAEILDYEAGRQRLCGYVPEEGGSWRRR